MFRKDISAQGLHRVVREEFEKVGDPRVQRSNTISYADGLSGAHGMFALKSPSLLQFEQTMREPTAKASNLRKLFGMEEVASDTTMREIVDEVPSEALHKPFKRVFSIIQRGKDLESYGFMGNYLVSVDGTGFFSSKKVHCAQCMVKRHRNGEVTYYHQALAGVLIHPDKKAVIPFSPEPISNEDGTSKNDCERQAAKRFLMRLRREHPHLKVIITEDGLASNAPHIRLLQELKMGFILGCKPGDHTHLFEFIDASDALGEVHHHAFQKEGLSFRFRFMNQVPLNDDSQLMVNFLECWQTDAKGKVLHFSWVTDQMITEETCYRLMRGGRARWKVENETFNTLKNQGYNLEHNYGHGKKYLCNNLMTLMMLAFLVDQAQLLGCKVYQKAYEKTGAFYRLWEKFRSMIELFIIDSWDTLITACAFGAKMSPLVPDTS